MGRHRVVTDPRAAHQSSSAVSQGEIQRRSKKGRDGRLGKGRDGRLGKGRARGQQLDVRREKFQLNKSYVSPLAGKTGTDIVP